MVVVVSDTIVVVVVDAKNKGFLYIASKANQIQFYCVFILKYPFIVLLFVRVMHCQRNRIVFANQTTQQQC